MKTMLREDDAGLSLVFTIVQVFDNSIVETLLVSEESSYHTKRTPELSGARRFLSIYDLVHLPKNTVYVCEVSGDPPDGSGEKATRRPSIPVATFTLSVTDQAPGPPTSLDE